MPTLDTYIFFDGNCAEAMRFYERTLGGELQKIMTYADSPDQHQCSAENAKDLVMHACLVLEGRMLMASDTPPDFPKNPRSGFALALNYPSPAEAARIFDALCNGGSVTMPMQKTFWAESFGMLTDRFGTAWMVGGGAQAS